MRDYFVLTMARCRTWAEWLRPRRKYQTMALVFFVLLVGFVWMLTATPAHAIVNEIVNGVIRVLSYVMLSVAHIAIGFTLFFLRFFINLASYNGYIDAPIVVVGWTMVRDIANMFFVVIMLVIAFATILGLEQYEWRKLLVKLLLMAIFINFSNMIAQLVIDIAHVFTITFLNAISAAAGGNLINMFKLEKIVSIVGATPDFTSAEDFGVNILVASMAATFFAILSATTMGAYAFAMAIRVVVLWVAIILAPLAFVLAVLPATQSKAQEWWKEFSHHVLAAPIMVFFLWLAFATLGQGDAIQQIEQGASERLSIASAEPPKLSLSEVTSWENMASFFVAMAFLWIGIEKVQELGIRGGGVIGGAIGFAKKVATIATGYAAGRWLVGKAGEGVKLAEKGAGSAAWWLVRGEDIKRRVQREWAGFQGKVKEPPFKIEKVKKMVRDEETGEMKEVETGEERLVAREPKGFLIRYLHKRAIQTAASKKMLEKTENFLKTKEEMLTSLTQGIPSTMFLSKDEDMDAVDRRYQGIAKQLKARSGAKTEEWEAVGAQLIAEQPRMQFRKKDYTEGIFEAKGRTEKVKDEFGEEKEVPILQAKEVAQHKINAERRKADLKRLEAEVTVDYAKSEKGRGQIALATAAEKQAHLEAEKLGEVKKEEERAYVGGEKGKEELEEEAKIKLRTEEMEKQIKELEAAAAKKVAGEEAMVAVISRINLAEQGAAAAEAFVKGIKSKTLMGQFEGAANLMRKILKKTGPELKAEMNEAQAGTHGQFVAALATAQGLKVQEEATGLTRRQAEDAANNAFVYKPRYGSISPSTAYAEYAKSQMDEFRKLERLAAMKKATDIMAHLQQQKDGGEALSVDQEAQLAAASNFLTEEAWVDDKGEYVFGMLKKLQKGELGAKPGDDPEAAETKAKEAEKEKWQTMAKMFHKIGWIEGNVGPDGTIAADAKIIDHYDRQQAADLQNLSLTGLDVDLVQAHNAVAKRRDENENIIKATKAEAREDAIDEALTDVRYQPELAEVARVTRDQTRTNVDKIREQKIVAVRKKAQKEAQAAGMSKDAAKTYIADAEGKAREQLDGVQNLEEERVYIDQEMRKAMRGAVAELARGRIEARVKGATDGLGLETDYWKLANEVLATAGVADLDSADKLKERYSKHGDMMQYAARKYKADALATGHEELGMNQDYDETKDVYRFQTVQEGRDKLRADRVKIDVAKLTSTDQYHSNGTLDFKTMVLDDFLEEALSTSIGRATKAIELARMPERSLKGHFYVHKNEDAQKQIGSDGQTNYAVISSESARKKFAEEDGDTTAEQQRNHILARGVLAHLMSGWKGMALGAQKLYGHISEKDAQQGIINLKVGDREFHTVQELAAHIKEQIESNNAAFMDAFGKSRYAHQRGRVVRQLEQITKEKPKADFGRSEEEEQATR